MAIGKMALGSGGNSGLTKTTTWTDAVANAKSYIFAIVKFTDNSVSFKYDFVVPKEEISSTSYQDVRGYYYNSTINYAIVLDVSSTSCTSSVYKNTTPISSISLTFYYD